MPTLRQARVAEMIKRDLAEILQREMRDPRLTMVAVTNVEVYRDFTFAKIFISLLGDEQEKTDALKALQGASGYLRGQLGKLLDLRVVPQLAFRYDTGIDKGVRMFDLLRAEGQAIAENHASDAAAISAVAPIMPDDEALEDDDEAFEDEEGDDEDGDTDEAVEIVETDDAGKH